MLKEEVINSPKFYNQIYQLWSKKISRIKEYKISLVIFVRVHLREVGLKGRSQ